MHAIEINSGAVDVQNRLLRSNFMGNFMMEKIVHISIGVSDLCIVESFKLRVDATLGGGEYEFGTVDLTDRHVECDMGLLASQKLLVLFLDLSPPTATKIPEPSCAVDYHKGSEEHKLWRIRHRLIDSTFCRGQSSFGRSVSHTLVQGKVTCPNDRIIL